MRVAVIVLCPSITQPATAPVSCHRSWKPPTKPLPARYLCAATPSYCVQPIRFVICVIVCGLVVNGNRPSLFLFFWAHEMLLLNHFVFWSSGAIIFWTKVNKNRFQASYHNMTSPLTSSFLISCRCSACTPSMVKKKKGGARSFTVATRELCGGDPCLVTGHCEGQLLSVFIYSLTVTPTFFSAPCQKSFGWTDAFVWKNSIFVRVMWVTRT